MKRLLLDLEKYNSCKDDKYSCSYPYHPFNSGIGALLEYATFIYICRQCEEAPCVSSCPKEALEKVPAANLKRYNNRCISCKSCMLACPFGTIVPEVVPYLSSRCDLCIGRLNDNEAPACAANCSNGVLSYCEVEESKEKNIYILNDHLTVHCVAWQKPPVAKKI